MKTKELANKFGFQILLAQRGTMKSYMPAVVSLILERKALLCLDAPCGSGWLRSTLPNEVVLDGVDLYESAVTGYRSVITHDLDNGLPQTLEKYDAIISCEGLEHLGNPLLFLQHCCDLLKENGVLILSTPNSWYPGSRFRFFRTGFFPSFPSLVGKVHRGSHMHILPWSFPQLWLFFRLAGFSDIKLVDLQERKPKHLYEHVIGIPMMIYCLLKVKKSKSKEEIDYWTQAGSKQSLYGRRLLVWGVRSKLLKKH